MVNNGSNDNEVAIKTVNLTKYYGKYKGIEKLNFEVHKGTIHGFLGPNGAGKTTTLRILVGLLKQSAGEAYIFNHEAGSFESKELVGYLPSDFELYYHQRVKDYLDYIENLRGKKGEFRSELIEKLQLDESRKTRELSRGNKQKVAIVAALMHNPPLVIADEPTAGLDPLMQHEFDKIIKDYVKKGNTVLLSSHILYEVQEICDIVTIIKEGNFVSHGTVDQLVANLPRKAILIVKDGTDDNDIISRIRCLDSEINALNKITLHFNYPVMELIDQLKSIPEIKNFVLPEPDLEEYFLPIYTQTR